jgi:hypothetical protein
LRTDRVSPYFPGLFDAKPSIQRMTMKEGATDFQEDRMRTSRTAKHENAGLHGRHCNVSGLFSVEFETV